MWLRRKSERETQLVPRRGFYGAVLVCVAGRAEDAQFTEIQEFDAEVFVCRVMDFQVRAGAAAFAVRLRQAFEFGGEFPFRRVEPLQISQNANGILKTDSVIGRRFQRADVLDKR
jgi:hypothetical protein